MTTQTSVLEMLDRGAVYRNPDPGYRYTFACHSHAIEIQSRELLCAYQRGQALYSVDSVLAIARSRDGGRLWMDQGLIHDPAADERCYSYHGPLMTRLADGSLILNAIRMDRSDPDQPLFNEQTGGMVRCDTVLMRSNDNGVNWSAPQAVAFPDDRLLTPASPIVELASGELFLSCDQWHGYDDPGPYRPRTIGLFSADGGRTWGRPVTFGDGEPAGKAHWHGRIVRLRDDRLFTMMWSIETDGNGALPLHYCIGSPDGREWTTPEPTNIPGQTNWVVELDDGRMAVIYTVRESKPPGFYVACSEDGGRSWNLDGRILVWDATNRDKIGVHAPDAYPRSHDTIAYGAPTAMALDDGSILATFWCTEMAVTQIGFARLCLL